MWNQSILLAGDASGAWLAVSRPGGYRLAVKPLNQPWEEPWDSGAGKVTAIAPVRSGAVVFFARGGLVKYYLDTRHIRTGAQAPEDLWPEGVNALAACAEPDNPGAVLVLINRAARPAQASGPGSFPATATSRTAATAPATRRSMTRTRSVPGRELALLRYADNRWEQVSVLPTDLAAPAFHACLCAGGGEVYVLLDEPEPVLAVLGDGRWRRVDLPVEFRRCRALAAATLRLGVTAVGFEPGAPGQMLFSTLRPAGWLPVERVRAEQEPVEWKATPAVAQLGDRLAVVWKDRGDWFFGTFGYDGDLVSGRAKILPERGGEALALDVQNYFFLGVLGILAALVFWPGRTLRPGPILLPPRLPPARLSRRAVAFLIDYLPISLGTFSLAGQRDWQAALEAVRRGAAPEWSVYCFVASLAVLVVYGVVMEYRFGATLGKMAMRMVVVTGEGQRPRLRQILLRNLAKVLELRTLLLLAFVLLTRYRQRLGDWVARTVVVDAYPPEPPLGQTEDKPEPRR